MRRKYEFTGETRTIQLMNTSVLVKQIRSLIDIPSFKVRVGDLGGWIEHESNLAHPGTCWLHPDSMVIQDARMTEHALLEEASILMGDAVATDRAVLTNATVLNHSKIAGHAIVKDSIVSGTSVIGGNSRIMQSRVKNMVTFKEGTCEIRDSEIKVEESFSVYAPLKMRNVRLELKRGEVWERAKLLHVRGSEVEFLHIQTPTTISKTAIQRASIQTFWNRKDPKENGVTVNGQQKITIRDGRFAFFDVSIRGEVSLDGGTYTSNTILLSHSELHDFASIERSSSEQSYQISGCRLEGASRIHLKRQFPLDPVCQDVVLGGDDVLNF